MTVPRLSPRSAGLLSLFPPFPLLLLLASPAFAQDAGAPSVEHEEAPPPAQVSPEELEALQRAMGEDVQAQPGKQAPAAEAPSSEAASAAPPAPGISLQSLNPDLAFIADLALAWFDPNGSLETGGHDPTQTGFTLQELELTAGKSVDPYFRFDANIVFHQEGVEIEEVYATTLALPYRLQMRAGQFLTRFGRMNATHPHTWAFVDQPFSIGRVLGGDGNRGLGTELSWLAPLPWYLELVGSVTDAHGGETARSFYGDADVPINSPLDFEYLAAVKQFFPLSDDLSLLWGLSAANGPNANGVSTRTQLYGTDLYLKYRPISDPSNPTIVSLQAEALYRVRSFGTDSLRDLNGYAELLWRFDPRWATAARYEFGTPSYGSNGEVAFDPLDPEWTSFRHRVSANLTFWPTEFSRLRLQAGSDVPTWRDRPIYSVMLAFEFAVGAHGAHSF